MYHLISHVFHQNSVPIYGPVNVLEQFLTDKKQQFTVVTLPLELSGENIVRQESGEVREKTNSPHLVIKVLKDFAFIAKYIFNSNINRSDTVISADPLNTFLFALLKPFFDYRLIYYTADYSDNRFGSVVLNAVYAGFDRVCLYFCDENWCVSSRIVDKRSAQGYGEGAVFLPNTPIFDVKPHVSKHLDRNELVYVGRMDENMNILLVLRVFMQMRSTNNKLRLALIGGGSLDHPIHTLIDRYNLGSYLTHHGPLENAKVISILRKSGIGLALYSGGNSWNEYGDSMKIREYQYFGLPVITTTVPSNASEVLESKSGIVISNSELHDKSLMKAIKTIQNSYSLYCKNAVTLAVERNKTKILEGLLNL